MFNIMHVERRALRSNTAEGGRIVSSLRFHGRLLGVSLLAGWATQLPARRYWRRRLLNFGRAPALRPAIYISGRRGGRSCAKVECPCDWSAPLSATSVVQASMTLRPSPVLPREPRTAIPPNVPKSKLWIEAGIPIVGHSAAISERVRPV